MSDIAINILKKSEAYLMEMALATVFDLPVPFLDIDGTSRPQDGDGNGSAVFDIGAYEYGSVPPGGGYILTININGNGSVTRQPDEPAYSPGTAVTLVGTPDSGNTFDSWGGALSGSDNPTTITMDSHKTLTANFKEIDVTPPSIVAVSAAQNSIEILFDELLEQSLAENINNYSINNGIYITAASLDTDTVTLTTSAHTEGTYTLTVSNVQDTSGNAITQTTEDYIYDEGLGGYWKLDDGSGNTASDSSGNSNTGTLINGPSWTSGILNGGVQFDGIDDAVEIPTTGWQVNSGTITLWANAADLSGVRYLFGHNVGNSSWSNRIQLYTDEGNLGLGLGDSHTVETAIQNLALQT